MLYFWLLSAMKLFVKETTTVLKWIIPLYLILLWLPDSTTDCSQQSGKACKDCIEVSGRAGKTREARRNPKEVW
ncbi:hypothetical protein P5673_014248 [Acropora cervicornis]|uniref:Uncharacterized protein n=1 Tax=Acropora cervicornis TaxID=6130 RepID=A0AAD9QKG5_ACRCE|nr:hypothetical protein P5673_014248 [Acropora cervicornis]